MSAPSSAPQSFSRVPSLALSRASTASTRPPPFGGRSPAGRTRCALSAGSRSPPPPPPPQCPPHTSHPRSALSYGQCRRFNLVSFG